METLKDKIEWMLDGGFLTDNKENNKYAYGLDLKKGMFFAISKRSVKAKKPRRLYEDPELPLDDIDEKMKIFKSSNQLIK